MTTIRVIDFETTGLEPPAEVVEVGYCDLVSQSDGSWIVCQPQSWLCAVQSLPPETRAVHHITMAEIGDAQVYDETGLIEMSDHCAAVVAHNFDFEKKWLHTSGLIAEICTYKVALRVWPEAPSHSNSCLRYWLEDQGLLSLDAALAMPPHRAGPDAYVTAHIIKALLDLGIKGRDMIAWTLEPRLFPTCPIGEKWRGKPWHEVDGGFLGWMLRQPDMAEDLKWNAQREIARRSEGHAK